MSGKPYEGWSVEKNLRLGRRSQRVLLLKSPEGKHVVLKTYDPHSSSQRARFVKEVAVLRRLKGCPHVPTLFHVDVPRCAMWISYCGPVARLTAATRKRVHQILKELARYGVYRVNGVHRQFHAESIFPKNICEADGRVFLIDFGSGSWELAPRPLRRV